MKHRDPQTELLALGLDDLLQLFEVMSVVGSYLDRDPQADPAIVWPTLHVIRDLLESELAIAGDVAKNDEGLLTVRPWCLTSSATLTRIEKEWRELDEPPNLGEVVWLELTDKGRAEARKRLGKTG